MEKKKKLSDHHKNTTTQEHQILLGKPFGVRKKPRATPKNIHYENSDYNFQVYVKLESTINWIYNKYISRSK